MRLLQPSRGNHAAEIERTSKRPFSLGWLYAGNLRPCYEPVRSYEPRTKTCHVRKGGRRGPRPNPGNRSKSEKVGRQSRNHRAH